jgi:hypothetical protein
MADDVFTIETEYGDVAELGKGYVNRVDGQRILLPLGKKLKVGDGARYVVHLADGTPAFAGAGRCAEVSDQGKKARKGQRYETMIDSLQFDDRSRPVYEYIVAVRDATYGGGQAASARSASSAQTAQASAEPELEDADAEAELLDAEANGAEALDDDEGEATEFIGRPGAERGGAPAAGAAGGSFAGALEGKGGASSPAPARSTPAAASVPSVMPSGMLRRPVLGVQWQPATPRHPTPRPASGLFRYPEGPLPRPARAPYPDLDPSQWVRPVVKPGASGATASRSVPPGGDGGASDDTQW